MASKMCCTVEEGDRASSPALPNARLGDATPAKRPLLSNQCGSNGSRFTSARSEDLHELRQIFNNATDPGPTEATLAKSHHARAKRPSVYSLHSLHRVKSVHAFLKRKLSINSPKTDTDQTPKSNGNQKDEIASDPDTVIKSPRDGPVLQLKLTKDDLRRDLFSDKKPAEGGYDSDAEVLDDVARNIGKKTPSKRPSVHSIDWTPSTGSKPTPGSTEGHGNAQMNPENQQYEIRPPALATQPSLSGLFSHFASSPNLRIINPAEKDRKLRRSHSFSIINRPPSLAHPPLPSPLQLPSIRSSNEVPWSAFMAESLRLSQFAPVRPPSPELVHTTLHSHSTSGRIDTSIKHQNQDQSAATHVSVPQPTSAQLSNPSLHIHIQQPTSSRPSGSIREDAAPEGTHYAQESQDNSEDNPRRSVHLYSMRISHHLRSGSLLSWDALSDAPEIPAPPRPPFSRNASDMSKKSEAQASKHSRHQRRTSSTGFTSSKVPSRWGKVLHSEQFSRLDNDFQEDESSIYSSRPQSPPDSFRESLRNLSLSVLRDSAKNITAVSRKEPPIENSADDNTATPKASRDHEITNLQTDSETSAKDALLPRNNCVANTGKSKFREEFTPTPPRKKVSASASFMKFLRPRNSVRSRSDTNLETAKLNVSPDRNGTVSARNRSLSRSMMSLQAEQDALGKDKDAVPIWDNALKAHQAERASLFLPENKSLAVSGSPFRERSGSGGRPVSPMSLQNRKEDSKHAEKRLSLPLMHGPEYQDPGLFMGRRTLIQTDQSDISPGHEVQMAFDKQPEPATDIGAWGRYPSHTRGERAGSAGPADSVRPRDFALEAAVQFAMGADIGPTGRPKSPTGPGGKKKKKRIGDGRMIKSRSMTFGKTFLRNYAKIFRSQSTEFQRHGHGHRSSITTGGTLDFPELEMLPDVWRRGIVEEKSHESLKDEETNGVTDKGKRKEGDSMNTLRSPQDRDVTAGAPSEATDGARDEQNSTDRARVWSVYYENCIPNFPRASTDAGIELQDFSPSRPLSKHASSRSRTMPARFKHGRNASRISRASVGSVVQSFASCEAVEGDVGARADGDGRSVVSVRRSTMDLIERYREQEVSERERVLSLVRVESRK
ncbi:hypothetical protein CC78DRAFT_355595 [Lojkania enalia]|uniref:Uncharacterized protein n=1 Tax=Lojkania enalia TaxID=147567 RepID=A0A9P4K7E4_9PLEO|nr:hypothetical protein CC78DRAFT_355595 [Didymosphaeria enalia]